MLDGAPLVAQSALLKSAAESAPESAPESSAGADNEAAADTGMVSKAESGAEPVAETTAEAVDLPELLRRGLDSVWQAASATSTTLHLTSARRSAVLASEMASLACKAHTILH